MGTASVRRALAWVVVAACGSAAAFYQTWTSIGPPGGAVRELVVDPGTAGELWVGTDGGDHWTDGAGELGGVPALAVVVDPEEPQRLCAGTAGQGVVRLGPAPPSDREPRRPDGRRGGPG